MRNCFSLTFVLFILAILVFPFVAESKDSNILYQSGRYQFTEQNANALMQLGEFLAGSRFSNAERNALQAWSVNDFKSVPKASVIFYKRLSKTILPKIKTSRKSSQAENTPHPQKPSCKYQKVPIHTPSAPGKRVTTAQALPSHPARSNHASDTDPKTPRRLKADHTCTQREEKIPQEKSHQKKGRTRLPIFSRFKGQCQAAFYPASSGAHHANFPADPSAAGNPPCPLTPPSCPCDGQFPPPP